MAAARRRGTLDSRTAWGRSPNRATPVRKSSRRVGLAANVLGLAGVPSGLAERLRLGLADEMVEDLVQVPVEDALHGVEVLVQPVVGDARLREVVGPDLLAPLPCPDLRPAVVGDLGLLLPLGDVHQPRAQDAESLLLVPMLGLLVLAGHDEPGRLVGDADRRVVPVDVLAA